jgi:hypothetical protein
MGRAAAETVEFVEGRLAGGVNEGVATTTGAAAVTVGTGARPLAMVWAGTVVATVAPMAVVASQATATPNQPTPRARTTGSGSRSTSITASCWRAAGQG